MFQFLTVTLCFLSLLQAAFAQDRALLIGINDYQSKEINDLQGPLNDVRAFQGMLNKQLGFPEAAVKTLLDEQATKAGILDAIDSWLVSGSQAGDHLVFYFSGHGSQLDDVSGDEQDHMDETIVAYDTKGKDASMVLDDEIAERLAHLKDRHIFAVFDSCHSGSMTRGLMDATEVKTPNWNSGSRSPDVNFNPEHQKESGFIEGKGNIIAMFAVAPYQDAIDDRRSDPKRPHGLFTDALIKGTEGNADYNRDGRVSFVELREYSRQESKEYCRQFNKNCASNELTPMLEIAQEQLGEDIRSFARSTFSAKPDIQSAPAMVSNVLVHGNDAGIQLSLAPNGRIRLGSTMEFKLHTPKSGKLLLFDVDGDKHITQLFPNNFQSEKALASCQKSSLKDGVKANTTVLIPDSSCMAFKIKARKPLGQGKAVAVLIEDAGVDTQDILGDGKSSFTPVEQSQSWLARLSTRLNAIVHEPDGLNRTSRWSMTSVDYEIVP